MEIKLSTLYWGIWLHVLLCFLGCSPDESDVPPVQGLSYSQNPAVYGMLTSIVPNAPMLEAGSATEFQISPPLPENLQFNTQTGVITGIPCGATETLYHTITARNIFSSASTILQLKVNEFQKFLLTDEKYAMLLDLTNPQAAISIPNDDVQRWSSAAYLGMGSFVLIGELRDNTGNMVFKLAYLDQFGGIEKSYDLALQGCIVEPTARSLKIVAGAKFIAILLDGVAKDGSNGCIVFLQRESTQEYILGINNPNDLIYAYGYFAATYRPAREYEGQVMFVREARLPDVTPVVFPDIVGKNPTQIAVLPTYLLKEWPERAGEYAQKIYFMVINSYATGENADTEHTASIIKLISVFNENGEVVSETASIQDRVVFGAFPTALAYGQSHFVVGVDQDSLAVLRVKDDYTVELAKKIDIGFVAKSIVYGNQIFAIPNSFSSFVTLLQVNSYNISQVLVNANPLQVLFGYPYFLVRHPNDPALLIDARTFTTQQLQVPSSTTYINQSVESVVGESRSTFFVGNEDFCILPDQQKQDLLGMDVLQGNRYMAFSWHNALYKLAVSTTIAKKAVILEWPSMNFRKAYDAECYGIALWKDFAFAGGDRIVLCDENLKFTEKLTGEEGGWTITCSDRYIAMLNHLSQSASFYDPVEDKLSKLDLSKKIGDYAPYNIAYGNGYFAVLCVSTVEPNGGLFLIISELDLLPEVVCPVEVHPEWDKKFETIIPRLVYGNGYFAVINPFSRSIWFFKRDQGTWQQTSRILDADPYAIAYGNRKFAITSEFSDAVFILTPEKPEIKTIYNIERPRLIHYGDDHFIVGCYSLVQHAVLLDAAEGKIQAYFLRQLDAPLTFTFTAFASNAFNAFPAKSSKK